MKHRYIIVMQPYAIMYATKNKGAPHGEARPYSYEKSVITGSD